MKLLLASAGISNPSIRKVLGDAGPSIERFVGSVSAQVAVYGENDFRSPYASGSARVDAYVICPCSMAC